MKEHERRRGLWRAPSLVYQLLTQGRYDFVYDQMPVSVRGMSWAKRANLARAGLNLVHRRPRPWSMPLHMQFELTNYCNLRCPVCPTGNHQLTRPPRAMDLELFQKVYDEVAPYLLTASLWGWGESILHPGLRGILQVASRHETVTFLSTNGVNLQRDEVIEAILEFPPSYLIVAIDGLCDETNSRFRVGARLEPALRGVLRLAEMKRQRGLRLPVLHMRFMVMSHNEQEVPSVSSFAAQHGFDMLSMRTLLTVISDVTDHVHSQFESGIPEFQAYPEGHDEKSDYVCMQPYWFPSLYADGSVVSCEQDFSASQKFGAISGGVSFRDIWYGETAARIRQAVRKTPETLFCRHCPARDRCATDVSVSAEFFNPEISNPLVVESRVHA